MPVADDTEFYVADAAVLEVLPKGLYVAWVDDIYREMFTPSDEYLKPGDSTEPYPQFVVTWTVQHSRTKKVSVLRTKLRDKPGRGAQAGLTKFMVALGLPTQFRKSEVVGQCLEIFLEDKGPDGKSDINWIKDYMSVGGPDVQASITRPATPKPANSAPALAPASASRSQPRRPQMAQPIEEDEDGNIPF